MKRLVFLLLSAALIAGCSSETATPEETHKTEAAHAGHTEHQPNGDLQEKTASAGELPDFLQSKPEELQTVYLAAAENEDILSSIPCYCGCGESAGHRSSLNCFVAELREDGSVVWDDHGTRCLVCVEIAVKSINMKAEGKTPKEIRETIDAAYGEGYAEPTPTPMPS